MLQCRAVEQGEGAALGKVLAHLLSYVENVENVENVGFVDMSKIGGFGWLSLWRAGAPEAPLQRQSMP